MWGEILKNGGDMLLPYRSKKPCRHPGCPALISPKQSPPYCEDHIKGRHRSYDDHRKTATERGYDYRWQKARKSFLKKNPLCVHCQQENIIKPATVVDHIKPHRGDMKLFWDRDNWQPLCETHHNRKTAQGR